MERRRGVIRHGVTRRGVIRRWLLVVALAAALIGMHHLLLAEAAGSPAGTAPTAASPMSAVAVDTVHTPAPATTAAAPDAAGPDMAGPVQDLVAVGVGLDAAMSMLMQPCLAVLTALILLFLTVGVVAIHRRSRPGRTPDGPVVVVWPRPPPRTAVRLAQLCVLRT